MRKQVHLPISRRKSYGSMMEEFEAEKFENSDFLSEILQAANNDPNFKIYADPETAEQINNCFGAEIAFSLEGDYNDN